MPEYGLARRIWRAIYPMLAYLGITFAVTFFAIFGYAISYILKNVDDFAAIDTNAIAAEMMTPIAENALAIALLGYLVAFVVFMLIWNRTRRRYPRWNGGGFRIVPALCAAGAAIGLNTLLSMVIGISGAAEMFESYDAVTEVITSGSFWIQLAAVGIVGPIAEELCFRGITLSRLSSVKYRWVAIAVQAVLFGIVHLNILQSIYAALLGVFLAFVVMRYRSIIYGIIAHIAFNTYTVVLVQLVELSESIFGIIAIGTLIAGAASVVGFVKCAKPEPYTAEVAAPAIPALDDSVW